MINQTVSHYRIIRQIGAGGMGVVYEAEDEILKRRVAVKTLKNLNSQKARLLREARAVSRLNHPHIATIFDYGETGEGQPFIIMELIEGKPLNEFIRTNRTSLSQIINIIVKIAEALSAAHKYGIVHRDIKPSNILVTDDENVKVLDFGLSKQIESNDKNDQPAGDNLEATRTQEGVILGTPLYLSPEQAAGKKVDVRSDVFSLGTLLYESITGKLPFYADGVIEICAKILRDNPPPPSQINPAIPAALDRITLKALAKEPKNRYQNIDELKMELRELQIPFPKKEISAPPPAADFRHSVSQKLYTSFRDVLRYRFSSALIFLVMAFAGFALYFYWQTNYAAYQPLPAAEIWYEKGERALNDGLFFIAQNCFKQAIEQDDSFVMAHARYAETLFELGYIENARQERERTNEIIAGKKIVLSFRDNLRRQAINNTLLFDNDSALKNYQQLAESGGDSNKKQEYLDLGKAYERSENLPQAIESYQKLLDYNADSAAANLRLGVLYGRRQDYEKAESYFAKAEYLYKIQNDSEGEIEVSYQRGLQLSGKGFSNQEQERAQAEIEKSLKKAEVNEIPFQQIKCLLLMSRFLRASGKTKEAPAFALQAISLAQQNNIDNLHAQSILELGTDYFFLSRLGDAKTSYDEALRLARQYNATVVEKRVLLQFGAFYVYQHQSDEALNYVNQVQSFFEKGNYSKDLLDLLSVKAQAIAAKGDYRTALGIYRDLLARADAVGDLVQKARNQKGFAMLLAAQDDLRGSLAPMYESYAGYNSINKRLEAGYSLIAYADILCQMGRCAEAAASLNQADGLAAEYEGLKPRVSLVRAKKALGERNFDEAVKFARQIIAADPELKKVSAVEAKSLLAFALAQSGQKLKAEELIKEMDLTNPEIKKTQELARIYLIRAEIFLENDLPGHALEDAQKAQKSFRGFGKPSFEWIAWSVVSFAQRKLGKIDEANRSAANADMIFSTLSQKFTQNDFNSYAEKPDVKFYRLRLLKNSS